MDWTDFELGRNDAIANRRDLISLAEEGTRRERLALVKGMVQLDHPVVAVAGLRSRWQEVRAGCRTRERVGRPENG